MSGEMNLEKLKEAADLIKSMGPRVDIKGFVTPIMSLCVGAVNPKHEITIVTKIGPFDTKEEATAYMEEKFNNER